MKLAQALSLPLALALGGCAWTGATAPSGSTASREESGSLAGRVRITKGRRYKTSHADAVVYLVGVPEKVRGARHQVAEIRQIGKAFVPDVAVVQKGTTIAFPNDDRDYHNVYSLSPACSDGSSGSGFDLGEYKSGSSKSVRCNRAGEVAVFCNIHPEMAAKVLVVETKYYARADRDGTFHIKNVPPGTYTYVAWQPWGKSHKGKITIAPGEASQIDVTLKEGRKPQPSYCADGSLRGAYGCKD